MKKIFFLLLLSFSALSFSVLSYSLELEIVPTAAEVLETEAAGLVARVDFEQADQLLGALGFTLELNVDLTPFLRCPASSRKEPGFVAGLAAPSNHCPRRRWS